MGHRCMAKIKKTVIKNFPKKLTPVDPNKPIKKKTLSELVPLIPEGASRVLVIDYKGNRRYRDPLELDPLDEIQVNKQGIPIVTSVSPGRPKVVPLEPLNDIVKEILKRKKESLEDDPMMRAAKHDTESPEVLRQALLALGEEAASIKFERQEAERKGQDATNQSHRRIGAIKVFVETWMKRKELLGSKEVDTRSPVTMTMIDFVLDTVREAMTSCGEQDEMIKTVFAKTAQLMRDETWEVDLRNRMKNAS